MHVRGALLLHEAFQSTRPVRGATAWDADQRKERYDFNPRAPCGARQPPRAAWRGGSRDFNPRAPCGARLDREIETSYDLNFKPRAPCGARPHTRGRYPGCVAFQSTRPVRGATSPPKTPPFTQKISIHAPRAGRDHERSLQMATKTQFQSTRPVRGATREHRWHDR